MHGLLAEQIQRNEDAFQVLAAPPPDSSWRAKAGPGGGAVGEGDGDGECDGGGGGGAGRGWAGSVAPLRARGAGRMAGDRVAASLPPPPAAGKAPAAAPEKVGAAEAAGEWFSFCAR